jgi:hypothetical protein
MCSSPAVSIRAIATLRRSFLIRRILFRLPWCWRIRPFRRVEVFSSVFGTRRGWISRFREARFSVRQRIGAAWDWPRNWLLGAIISSMPNLPGRSNSIPFKNPKEPRKGGTQEAQGDSQFGVPIASLSGLSTQLKPSRILRGGFHALTLQRFNASTPPDRHPSWGAALWASAMAFSPATARLRRAAVSHLRFRHR